MQPNALGLGITALGDPGSSSNIVKTYQASRIDPNSHGYSRQSDDYIYQQIYIWGTMPILGIDTV